MFSETDEGKAYLEQLSHDDFLHVGLNQIAYIRPATGQKGYGVYAADGTQISVMETYDTALAAVRFNDMHPVTVQ